MYWFLKELKIPLYILRLYGICSFSLSSTNNQIISQTRDFAYTFLLSSTIFALEIYFINYTLFTELKIDFFKKVYTMTALFLMVSTITIYIFTIISSTKNRNLTAKFLNDLNTICIIMEKLNINRKIHSRNRITILFIIYIVFNSIGVTYLNLNYSLNMTICSILSLWMEISIFLTIGFILYVAAIVLKQFTILLINLDETLHLNLSFSENYQKLTLIFERLDELVCLKSQLRRIFGGQLLLSFTYDFVTLTISVYSAIFVSRQFDSQLEIVMIVCYYIVFQILPHSLKVFLITQIMDKLEKQVNIMFVATLVYGIFIVSYYLYCI